MNRNALWPLLFLTLVAGCHRHKSSTGTVQPPAAPVAASAAIPATLVEAEAAFRRRDFLSSSIAFETFFESGATTPEMDRLRFHYGVAQSLSGIADIEKAASETFRQLVNDFPDSPYAPPARMALSLQGDITRLKADKVSQEEKIQELTALIPPAPPVLPVALAEAESAYDAGDFATAAKAYEVYLQSKPESDEMDRTLLHFGIAQTLSGTTARETATGINTLNQLVKDFPNSPYASYAGRIVALRQEIQRVQQADLRAKDEANQKLKEELDNIKKVDSQRRRTP